MMRVFDHKHAIEQNLRDTVDGLVTKNNLPIVFGHVIWGGLSKKGALRMSHVKPNESLVKTLLSKDIAFNRHIKEVGRNKTFLDFLLLYWFKNKSFGSKNECKRIFSFQIKEQTDLLLERENTISINQSLSDVLAPTALIKKYFEILDGKIIMEEEKEYYTRELDACRYRGLDLFVNDNHLEELNCLTRLSKNYDETTFENANRIHVLGAIQSALLFVKGSYPDINCGIGFISNSIAIKADGDDAVLNNPIIVLSTSIDANESPHNHATLDYENIKAPIENFCREHMFINTERITNFIKRELSHYIHEDFKILIQDHINEFSPLKIQPHWVTFILYWNSVLVQYLRNSIHEGKSLNFTFVVADVSEIKDCGLFEIVHLDFSGDNYETFHPYNLSQDFDESNFPKEDFPFFYDRELPDKVSYRKFIDYITRNIEKKNYSWFQDGKYALLWDATFPSKHPHSLIRIKNSSWEILINEIRNQRGKEFLEKISLAIVFLRQDQSGGLIIKTKLVSSFRKSSPWSLGLLQRDNRVKHQIRAAIESWQIEEKEKLIFVMSEVIASISDDPHSGCILVIAKSKPDFESMGLPWRILPRSVALTNEKEKRSINPLHLSMDELAALMGMDGATCIYLDSTTNQPAIAFRNILKIDSAISKRTFDYYELDGEGSRKWSSLNTARMKNIDLVIAVSQDGPIYQYIPIGDNISIEKLN